MLGQQMINFERRNLDAAARDHVLGAADQFDKAAGVDAGEIAGLEIAVGDRRRVKLRIVEITEHAERRADLQLAVRGDAERNVLGRPADRTEALWLFGRPTVKVAG